jgi:peptidoglycan hydrolase-like protein with peptidoglycan-binding domain
MSIIVENAIAARQSGANLRRQIATAGDNLVTAVDRIAGQVDSAITENQPNIQALASIISGLGQTYSQFTAIPESLKTAKDTGGAPTLKPQAGIGGLLSEKLQELQSALATLSTDQRRIANFVNAIVAKKPIETLRSCGVDVNAFAADITIDPAGPIEFVAGVAGSRGRVILGGRAPYVAELESSTAKGLSVRRPESFGPAFVVVATTETVTGEYSIYVADGIGHRKFVPVVVKPAGATRLAGPILPGPLGIEPTRKPLLAPLFTDSKIEDRIAMQKALCMTGNDIDGTWGPKTEVALKRYQEEKAKTATGVITTPPASGVMTTTIRDELLELSRTPDAIAKRCNTAALGMVAENLRGASFNVNDAELSVRGQATVDSVRRVVVVLLRVSKRPTARAITEDEVKQGLLDTAEVASVTKENIVIGNFSMIKPLLTP